MEKYTKEERRKIYLEAAEAMHNDLWWCICGTFKKLGYIGPYSILDGITHTCKLTFYEFSLFDPCVDSCVWFGFNDDEYAKQNRINALLLMAEMCND